MSPAVLMLFITLPASSQPDNATRPWKGYSILGNGNLTVVYSDDPRISDATHARGIQHFYFGDYTADYVASTSFRLRDLAGSETISMKNFFTAQTQTHLASAIGTLLCFVHPATMQRTLTKSPQQEHLDSVHVCSGFEVRDEDRRGHHALLAHPRRKRRLGAPL